MSRNRTYSISVLDKLYIDQDYHCALCLSKEKLDAHHIIPVANGGLDVYENLVLLCKSCHGTADTGVIVPEILRYCKLTCKTDPITYPRDKIGIYQFYAESIHYKLATRFDEHLINDVKKVIGHLKRQQDIHYRSICLKLLNAILMSNMHSENFTEPESNQFINLAKDLLKTPIFTDEIIFLKKQIFHSLAVLFHNSENYKRAIEYYTQALVISFHSMEYINKSMPEDILIKIHLTSSLYLNNQSKESFKMITEFMDIDFLGNQNTADAESFGWIRFAEHYIALNQIDEAENILHNINESEFNHVISPIHKVIMYKDLARIFIRNGDIIGGEKYLIIALTLASEYNYHNQIKKLLGMREVVKSKIDLTYIKKIFRL